MESVNRGVGGRRPVGNFHKDVLFGKRKQSVELCFRERYVSQRKEDCSCCVTLTLFCVKLFSMFPIYICKISRSVSSSRLVVIGQVLQTLPLTCEHAHC